jgi:hypothetical protein
LKNSVLLTVAVTGCTLIARGQTLQTNQLMIGDEVVDARVIDGKLVGEKWMAVSNKLVRIYAELDPDFPKRPSLRLFLSTPLVPSTVRVKLFHGAMYMADDFKTPSLTATQTVDICSSEDNARIVIMVVDNGPIYSSTNSGMTWITTSAPGKYEFPVSGAFIAAATIRPSAENQMITSTPAKNWYVVASAPDTSGLILTRDASQAAPALRITHSSGGVLLSWSTAVTGYVLQSSEDLSSTNWVDVPSPVNVSGQENQVLVSSQTGRTFYRLRSQ